MDYSNVMLGVVMKEKCSWWHAVGSSDGYGTSKDYKRTLCDSFKKSGHPGWIVD